MVAFAGQGHLYWGFFIRGISINALGTALRSDDLKIAKVLSLSVDSNDT
jgi:hypothetical protein